MKNRVLLTMALGLAAALPVSADTYSARNYAMGGAGVASSEFDVASSSNPALLTKFDGTDDFSLVLPSVGLEVSDKDDVLDTLDDTADLFDLLEDNIDNSDRVSAQANMDEIISNLQEISGNPLRVNAGAVLGVAIPSKRFAFAFDIRTAIEVGGLGSYSPGDAAILQDAIDTLDVDRIDDVTSSGLAVAAAVTEIALSMATEVSIGGKKVSIGITPKYQRVDTLLYAVTVNDFDSDDFEDNNNNSSNFNLDIGFAMNMGKNWTLGLVGRNLIPEEYDTVVFNAGGRNFQGTFIIDPTAVAGIAYQNNWFSATVEADLIKNKSFEELSETQFIRTGIEFDVLHWLQLRAGFRMDLEDVRDDVITAGIGLSPFDVFHLDISAAAGDNDTYGAAVEMRWTF